MLLEHDAPAKIDMFSIFCKVAEEVSTLSPFDVYELFLMTEAFYKLFQKKIKQNPKDENLMTEDEAEIFFFFQIKQQQHSQLICRIFR